MREVLICHWSLLAGKNQCQLCPLRSLVGLSFTSLILSPPTPSQNACTPPPHSNKCIIVLNERQQLSKDNFPSLNVMCSPPHSHSLQFLHRCHHLAACEFAEVPLNWSGRLRSYTEGWLSNTGLQEETHN